MLYRSYLWAPGIACLVVAALWRVPRRWRSRSRRRLPRPRHRSARPALQFFSSLRLWEDAVAKLPQNPVPLGSRTMYNLGREYLYAGLLAKRSKSPNGASPNTLRRRNAAMRAVRSGCTGKTSRARAPT